jgi:hypothetical protein
MASYQVLITINEFRVVEANSPAEAEAVAQKMYMNGDIELDSMPYFTCEDEDLIEELENA